MKRFGLLLLPLIIACSGLFAQDDSLLIYPNGVPGSLSPAPLQRNGVPAELHIYERGGDGFALKKQAHGHVEQWDREMEGWLRDRKLL